MKRSVLFFLMIQLAFVSSIKAQFTTVKGFDYKLLENKVLYIPEFEVKSDYAKNLIKKEKFEKLRSKEEQVAEYNRVWKEAMAESSYDATAYEIRGFDRKQIFKEKNSKALVLMYYNDAGGNWFAQLWVAAPKSQLVADALINGFDLLDVQDVKLMMNLLNFSLNEAIELEEAGSNKTVSDRRSKIKRNFVEFYDDIPNKTFLVQKDESENGAKADKRNEELIQSLKEEWTLCNYELVSTEEINKRRLNGDSDSFYWKNINYYTNNRLLNYRFAFLLSTDRDEVLGFFYYLGSQRLKPSTLSKIQDNIVKKGTRYKRQLEI